MDDTTGSRITFAVLRAANRARLPLFKNARGQKAHAADDGSDWTLSQWVVALFGEVGEVANIITKIERGDYTLEEIHEALGEELGDVQTYLDLLAFRSGIDLGEATRRKWNKVSERVGTELRIEEFLLDEFLGEPGAQEAPPGEPYYTCHNLDAAIAHLEKVREAAKNLREWGRTQRDRAERAEADQQRVEKLEQRIYTLLEELGQTNEALAAERSEATGLPRITNEVREALYRADTFIRVHADSETNFAKRRRMREDAGTLRALADSVPEKQPPMDVREASNISGTPQAKIRKVMTAHGITDPLLAAFYVYAAGCAVVIKGDRHEWNLAYARGRLETFQTRRPATEGDDG